MNKEDILNLIDIDKNHIDSFPMETEEGTKRTKDKFYRNAVQERNSYSQKQQVLFQHFLVDIENEMVQRVKQLSPQDKTEEYNVSQKEVDQLLDLVILNSSISNSFKLGLDYIVSGINNETSLENLNEIIKKFIERLSEVNVVLSLDDFKYTMFTEKYMSSFFRNSSTELMKDVFEKIYFTCPDIKMQLKMNLEYILVKNEDKLEKYVISLKEKLFLDHQVSSNNVIEKYTVVRYQSGNAIAKDEYYNTMLFTEGKKKISDYLPDSPARIKNYNMFAKNNNYDALNEEEKNHYNSSIMSLYVTLNEIKKYYRYEFILKDLLNRYKNKDAVKTQYTAKKKEIEKEEKNRMSIYKEYLKANGIGFLAKKNDIKIKNSMLKMNEQIRKLHSLYEEYHDIEITNQLNQLSQSASIYDLFSIALTSFPFIEKSLQKKEEEEEEQSLEESMNEYFKFIYNPNNSVLRKINVFADYDIVQVVAEKYKLLGLEVTKEMIDPENIDATMESVRFINLIQNIERSSISLSEIDELCRMKEIISKKENNSAEVI